MKHSTLYNNYSRNAKESKINNAFKTIQFSKVNNNSNCKINGVSNLNEVKKKQELSNIKNEISMIMSKSTESNNNSNLQFNNKTRNNYSQFNSTTQKYGSFNNLTKISNNLYSKLKYNETSFILSNTSFNNTLNKASKKNFSEDKEENLVEEAIASIEKLKKSSNDYNSKVLLIFSKLLDRLSERSKFKRLLKPLILINKENISQLSKLKLENSENKKILSSNIQNDNKNNKSKFNLIPKNTFQHNSQNISTTKVVKNSLKELSNIPPSSDSEMKIISNDNNTNKSYSGPFVNIKNSEKFQENKKIFSAVNSVKKDQIPSLKTNFSKQNTNFNNTKKRDGDLESLKTKVKNIEDYISRKEEPKISTPPNIVNVVVMGNVSNNKDKEKTINSKLNDNKNFISINYTQEDKVNNKFNFNTGLDFSNPSSPVYVEQAEKAKSKKETIKVKNLDKFLDKANANKQTISKDENKSNTILSRNFFIKLQIR